MTFWVVANWKMTGDDARVRAVSALSYEGVASEVVPIVCPPAVFLPAFVQLRERTHSCDYLKPFALGIQNVSSFSEGAFTGDISASMAFQVGARYALIGHCERVRYHQETPLQFAQKIDQCQCAGLCPIVCVGETHHDCAHDTLKMTLTSFQEAFVSYIREHPNVLNLPQLGIAYEPVWAVGADNPPSSSYIATSLQVISSCFSSLFPRTTIVLCYGGAVSEETIGELRTVPLLSGLLVGRASWSAHSWINLLHSV